MTYKPLTPRFAAVYKPGFNDAKLQIRRKISNTFINFFLSSSSYSNTISEFSV